MEYNDFFDLRVIPAAELVCQPLQVNEDSFVCGPTEEKLPIETIRDQVALALGLDPSSHFCVGGDRVAVLIPNFIGNYDLVKACMRRFSYVPQGEQQILSIRGSEWQSVLFRFSNVKHLAGKYRNGDVVLFRSNQPGSHLLGMFGYLSAEEACKPTPMSEYVGEIFDDGGDCDEDQSGYPFACYSINTLLPIKGFLSISFEQDVIRLATEEDKARLAHH